MGQLTLTALVGFNLPTLHMRRSASQLVLGAGRGQIAMTGLTQTTTLAPPAWQDDNEQNEEDE